MLENCYQKDLIEAGCDEAGRGCLAGSVFAAAVILPPDFLHPLLNDSKQMSARNRDTLRAIIERESVAWAVAEIPAGRIDEINILNASFEGMNTAIRQLSVAPQFIAVDGNRFRTQLTLPYACIVKGDGKYADIAADAEREWQRIDSKTSSNSSERQSPRHNIFQGTTLHAERRGARHRADTLQP